MLADFRRTFAPTPEEIKRAEDLIARIEREGTDYLHSLGFNDADIEIIRAIESEEPRYLSGAQSYSNRIDLIKSGIITVDDVRNDIKRRINGNDANEQRTNIRNT